MPHSAVKLAMIAALAVAGGACSSGDRETPARQPSTTSSPAGEALELRVVGRELQFDVETLAAPAGVAFTIVFDNRDRGIPHNIAVYRSGPPATDQLAMTEVERGPRIQRLAVPALEPGRYFYQCDVHPTTMTGTLMVTSRR